MESIARDIEDFRPQFQSLVFPGGKILRDKSTGQNNVMVT